jgi:hypothetical protein
MSDGFYIVNTADTHWDIIANNETSDDNEFNKQANAIPEGADPGHLFDAQGPNIIRIHYHREYNYPVDEHHPVDFAIQVKWMYGATYKGGGAFIQNVGTAVSGRSIHLPWHVNLKAVIGTPPHKEHVKAPIAELPLSIVGEVNVGKETHLVGWEITLHGDGNSQCHADQ